VPRRVEYQSNSAALRRTTFSPAFSPPPRWRRRGGRARPRRRAERRGGHPRAVVDGQQLDPVPGLPGRHAPAQVGVAEQVGAQLGGDQFGHALAQRVLPCGHSGHGPAQGADALLGTDRLAAVFALAQCCHALVAVCFTAAISRRYDKRANVFHGTVTVAAIWLWLRP
jgi:hypothetical protein